MIFYFSGTGNSLYVAKQLHAEYGTDLIDMAKAVMSNQLIYQLDDNETVYFVFPVYFSGLPGVVSEFINKMELKVPSSASAGNSVKSDETDNNDSTDNKHSGKHNKDEEKEENLIEIVGIATFGGLDTGSGYQLQKKLKKRGLKLRAFYGVKAPEDAIFYFNPPNREAALAQLKHLNDRVKDVIESINYHHRMPDPISSFSVSGLIHHFYEGSCKTAKFYATDKCISCGLCEKVCPVDAIKLNNGRPEWVKDTCQHCAACINRCPKDAIEYGRATKGRNRYVHPDLGKKYTFESQK